MSTPIPRPTSDDVRRAAIVVGGVLAVHLGIPDERYAELITKAVAAVADATAREATVVDEAAAIVEIVEPEVLARRMSSAVQATALQQLASDFAQVVAAHQVGDIERVGALLDAYVTSSASLIAGGRLQ